MSDATVICIVPVRNESWILAPFLDCAMRWADYVIVGDHNSDDESANIARASGCARVIPLTDPSYDEDTRRRVLIDEARRISKNALIVSIDADEMLSANWSKSAEWSMMRRSPPGTRFEFDWIELLPGLQRAAVFDMLAAFVDDGSSYAGRRIHSPRVPASSGPLVKLSELKLLHYIAIDPARMISRHNWYKCLEFVEHGERAWFASVKYQDTSHKTYDAEIVPVQEEWLAGYDWLAPYRAGANRSGGEQVYWWDTEVLNYFDRLGTHRFRRLNVWDVDWNTKARQAGRPEVYADPRSPIERWVHRFIVRNRTELKYGKRPLYRAINRIGRRFW